MLGMCSDLVVICGTLNIFESGLRGLNLRYCTQRIQIGLTFWRNPDGEWHKIMGNPWRFFMLSIIDVLFPLVKNDRWIRWYTKPAPLFLPKGHYCFPCFLVDLSPFQHRHVATCRRSTVQVRPQPRRQWHGLQFGWRSKPSTCLWRYGLLWAVGCCGICPLHMPPIAGSF